MTLPSLTATLKHPWHACTGGLPNNYGTWFYGRDGWCNGRDVAPLSWDVSADLAPPGHDNVLAYRSLMRGSQYNGTGGAEMLMSSYLVFYG